MYPFMDLQLSNPGLTPTTPSGKHFVPLPLGKTNQRVNRKIAIFDHIHCFKLSIPLLSFNSSSSELFTFFGRACLTPYRRLEKNLPYHWPCKANNPTTTCKTTPSLRVMRQRGGGVCLRRPGVGPHGFGSFGLWDLQAEMISPRSRFSLLQSRCLDPQLLGGKRGPPPSPSDPSARY